MKSSLTLAVLLLLTVTQTHARAQNKPSRNRGLEMLEAVRNDLKAHYYDTNFRGMDVDARFKAAAEKIKTAQSNGYIFSVIAQALSELDDSHTYLIPPYRGFDRLDYGWRMRMIGDKCFITEVKTGGDAEQKGLKAGDRILSIDGHEPTRAIFWKIAYSYYTLMPRPSVELSVESPGEGPRLVTVNVKGFYDKPKSDPFGGNATSSKAEESRRPRCRQAEGEAIVCRMPDFLLGEDEVDAFMREALKGKSLVLDMRGNGGGAEPALQRLVGYFFDHDVKIADSKGRDETVPLMAKTRGDKAFKGQLVVLVDSASASASEIFARLVQLENRGRVIGDRTSGAVMESRRYYHQFNKNTSADFWGEAYGVSITINDVFMTDGKSLEHVGVTPDELLLPTAADLRDGRDPVLAHAASLLGAKLDAEKAGALFHVERRETK